MQCTQDSARYIVSAVQVTVDCMSSCQGQARSHLPLESDVARPGMPSGAFLCKAPVAWPSPHHRALPYSSAHSEVPSHQEQTQAGLALLINANSISDDSVSAGMAGLP